MFKAIGVKGLLVPENFDLWPTLFYEKYILCMKQLFIKTKLT